MAQPTAQQQGRVVQDLLGWMALPTPEAEAVAAITLVPQYIVPLVPAEQAEVVQVLLAMLKPAHLAHQTPVVAEVEDQAAPVWAVQVVRAFLCCAMQTHWPT